MDHEPGGLPAPEDSARAALPVVTRPASKGYTRKVRTPPRIALALTLLFPAPSVAGAATEVQVRAGKVDLKTSGAPLSEVLERLERAAGFKVEREGSPPNPLVPALELNDRTPAQAVLTVLEGLGLNYALSLDDSGAQVEKLLLIGAGSSTPASAAAKSPPPMRPGFQQFRPEMPPIEEPPEDVMEDVTDAPEDVPDGVLPDESGPQGPSLPGQPQERPPAGSYPPPPQPTPVKP